MMSRTKYRFIIDEYFTPYGGREETRQRQRRRKKKVEQISRVPEQQTKRYFDFPPILKETSDWKLFKVEKTPDDW